MIDTTIPRLIWVLFTAITGMMAIGAGMIGYWYRRVFVIERFLCVAAGLLLIYPEGMSDVFGLVLFGVMLALQFFIKREDKTPTRATA